MLNIKEKLDELLPLMQLLDEAQQQLAVVPNMLINELFNYERGTDVELDQQLVDVITQLLTYSSTVQQFQNQLTAALAATNTDKPLTIEPVPNWYQLVAQYETYLAGKDAWSNKFHAGIGATLSELVAGSTAMLLNGINVAFSEAFLGSAVRDSSVYASTAALGINISRKTSASVKCLLTRTDYKQLDFVHDVLTTIVIDDNGPIVIVPELTKIVVNNVELTYVSGTPSVAQYTVSGSNLIFSPNLSGVANIQCKYFSTNLVIEPYSAFSVDGNAFYNRDIVVFDVGQYQAQCTLYEGQRNTFIKFSETADFQAFKLNEGQFMVSMSDVRLKVDGTYWTAVDSLWDQSNDNVYVVRTTGNGYTQILIGDGVHGMNANSKTIVVEYTITNGALANNTNKGLRVRGVTTDIGGTTIGSIVGGADEKQASTYKLIAADMFDAHKNVARKKDLVATMLNWPNVADVVVQNQADIGQHDLRWMNMVRVCVLPQTGDTLTDQELATINEYWATNGPSFVGLTFVEPAPYNINISVKAYLYKNVNTAVANTAVQQAVTELFVKRPGLLGKTITISDVMNAARIPNVVDYLEILLNSDVNDIYMPDRYRYPVLHSLQINLAVTSR